MTANPTDKLPLPDNADQIQEHNLTLPITTPKRLVETARLLRQTYFFNKIPENWIDIPTTINNDLESSSNLPNDEDILKELLDQKYSDLEITIPITSHQEIQPTLTKLHSIFNFDRLPIYLLNLPLLPEPDWDIFTYDIE